MLSSISPLGERAKGNSWWFTATAHIIGSTLGGLTIGGLLGLLGAVVLPDGSGAVPMLLLGVASIVAAGYELTGRALPSWHRQVNEDWLQMFRSWVYGGGFGFQLGLAVVTIITSAATYIMLLAAFLSGSVAGGLLIGGSFGLARGMMLLTAARAHDAEALFSLHRRIDDQAATVRHVTAATLSIAGLLLLVGGFTA